MKVEIGYEFKVGNSYPYIATADLDGTYISKLSKVSFDEAKAELIESLKGLVLTCPTIIPEKEVIEL